MKRDRRWTTFAEGGCGIRCGEEAGGFREDVRGAVTANLQTTVIYRLAVRSG